MKRFLTWFGSIVMLFVAAAAIAFLYYQTGVVRPEKLAALIDEADEVRVSGGILDDSPILFASKDHRDLAALMAATRVERPEEFQHCMCTGSPAIYLYRNGREIGQITNHHAQLLRGNLWWSDAPIVDAEAFLTWFDERGIHYPREMYERARKERADRRRREEEWYAAAPNGVLTTEGAANDGTFARLKVNYPDNHSLIRAPFAWYGSCGMSGGGEYRESDARLLLERFSTKELLAAVEDRQLTANETNGIARLFTDWDFGGKRPNDRELLSADLREYLYTHGMASRDEDDRHRASVTFGPESD
jgi:hypothetical protein